MVMMMLSRITCTVTRLTKPFFFFFFLFNVYMQPYVLENYMFKDYMMSTLMRELHDMRTT